MSHSTNGIMSSTDKRRRWGPLMAAFTLSCVTLTGCATTAADVRGQSPQWLSVELPKAADAVLRARIVEEMGLYRDPGLLPLVARAARDPDARVRVQALMALNAYGGDMDDSMRDDAYLAALEDTSSDVRKWALDGVMKRFRAGDRPKALLANLMGMAQNTSKYMVQLAAVKALTPVKPDAEIDRLLISVARSARNSEVRRSAVLALGARNVREARNVLQELRTTDLVPEVAAAAEQALKSIGGKVTDRVIAIGSFQTNNTKLKTFASSLRDHLASKLTGAKLASVVDRSAADEAIDELVFGDSISGSQAIELGKVLKADEVVYGKISSMGGTKVTAVIYRMDVKSQELLHSVEALAHTNDLYALQADLSRKFINTF